MEGRARAPARTRGLAFLDLRNGDAVPEAEIPLHPIDRFRDGVLGAGADGARLAGFFGRVLGPRRVRLVALLARDREGILSVAATDLEGEALGFPSLTPAWPQAHAFEREIAEGLAVNPEGHPWRKPLRHVRNGRGVPDLWPDRDRTIPSGHPFFAVEGEEVHEVAVGPVHAGIIEPGHFRFQCHGEEVLHLEIHLGYQHRGVERLLEGVAGLRSVVLAESIAGDTSVGHALAHCEAREALAGCRVTPRALAIRGIVLELERVANHLGDLGALGQDVGFLPTSAWFGRLRGDALNLLLEIGGNRYGRGLVRPGGVASDLSSEAADALRVRVERLLAESDRIADLLLSTFSVLERFQEAGKLPLRAVEDLGIVGPAARASGCGRDVRVDHPSGIFRFAHVPVSRADTGDVYARALVRRLEVERSLEFVQEQLARMPGGNPRVACGPPRASHFAVGAVEGWRGEILHAVFTDASGGVARYKVVDPSFHNWFGLALAMRGGEISDFPLCNKSFNLSYAGHDL
ncbi:MAG TPA: NADH-quinone oxidoreductase subunit C [Planctomycetota bacterium]|nr:NADH-quinone oxidoreductase subunit C [Planctomycetota bacterium]